MGRDENNEEYYRSLVSEFRMTELHALLNFAGQSRSGTKEVLQERALILVSLRSESINLKIKEIFKVHAKRFGTTDQVYKKYNKGSPSYSNPYTTPIEDSPAPSTGTMLPTFPDVELKPLPFYDIKDVLLKPASLQAASNARFQEQSFNFHLSPAQILSINESSFRNSLGRPEYRSQIQIRFSLNETSCQQDDNFPQSISLKVNNRLCALPPVIPTNKPGVDPKRPPQPINVTSLCKLSPTVANTVMVSWAVEVGRSYTVSIYLVDNLTFQDLLQRLKDKGEKHPDFTTALIKEKLRDQDQEITTASCKVSLACPLGKMRMKIPCRSSTCDHLQTFDATLYLQMNERKAKWKCPVCNKPALHQNLFIDGFFSQLVKSDRLPDDEHEIVLHNDGSWDPLPPRNQECESISSSAAPAPKLEQTSANEYVPIIEDSEDSDRSQQNTPALASAPPPADNQVANNSEAGGSSSGWKGKPAVSNLPSAAAKRPLADIDCITLDSDSEDEAVMPDKRSKPNQPPGSPDLICIDDD